MIKNFKVLVCSIRPLSTNEMVFVEDLPNKQRKVSRGIHIATIQAFARGASRIYVYFYNEDNPGKRYLEERCMYSVGGTRVLKYEQIENQIEQEDLIAHLKDYMLGLYYKGKTIDFFGTRCVDPLPWFKDESGLLLTNRTVTTEKLLDQGE